MKMSSAKANTNRSLNGGMLRYYRFRSSHASVSAAVTAATMSNNADTLEDQDDGEHSIPRDTIIRGNPFCYKVHLLMTNAGGLISLGRKEIQEKPQPGEPRFLQL